MFSHHFDMNKKVSKRSLAKTELFMTASTLNQVGHLYALHVRLPGKA